LPGKTRLRNDLLCVEWDVKPYTLNQSVQFCFLPWHLSVFKHVPKHRRFSSGASKYAG